MGKGSMYGAEIAVNPTENVFCSFLLAEPEKEPYLYYQVSLLRVVDGKTEDLGFWGGSVCFTTVLLAGEHYVIRVVGEFEGMQVPYLLSTRSADTVSCSHSKQQSFAVLPVGSTSCEDGVWTGDICTLCGEIWNFRRTTEHRAIHTTIDLTTHGGCYGTLEVASCACGKVMEQVSYNGCGEWNKNSYTDEEGRRITVEGYRCDQCGMKFTKSWYAEHDSATCTDIYYYTVMLVRNKDVIFNKNYTETRSAHNEDISVRLDEGAASCTDGVTVTYTCRDCGMTHSEHYKEHIRYEKECIDLKQYGCTCGGYARVLTCACGYSNRLEVEADCDFNREDTDNWLTSECRGQYQADGWRSFETSARKWTCAVTDPQCGFVIRYASHWVKDATACMAYLEEVWQFGYDAATDSCKKPVVIRVESAVYHEYTEARTETGEHYDCAKCGSYYHEDRIYDADGNVIKSTVVAEDQTGNSSCVYRQEVTERAKGQDGWYISRSYSESRYRDGNIWSTESTTTPLTELPFGDYGYSNVRVEKRNGTVTEKTESAYVNYKGYTFDLSRYGTREEWWEKYDYSYSFDGECTRTVHYKNSNGEDRTTTENACPYSYQWETVKEATCSQPGERNRRCPLCSRVLDTEIIEPDHEWLYVQGNGEEKMHICQRCGMMNVNGASGSIVMEDLTGTYGNGENYVVGYYARNNVSFTYYVVLVDAEGVEKLVLKDGDIAFDEVEGITAIAFSKAAVAAAAERAGLTAGSYQVRFVFGPEYDEGNFDYAVTFDDEIPETVTDDVMFPAKIEAGGELTFHITPDGKSEWLIALTCLNGAHTVLFDENGLELASAYSWDALRCTLEADRTYTVKITWEDENTSGWLAVSISHTAAAESEQPVMPESAA